MAVQRLPIPATSVTGTGGSEQTLLTASASGVTRIVNLRVNNPNAAAETITINVVPSAGSVAVTNEVVTDATVGVGENNLMIEDLVIPAGATVRLAASTTAKLVAFGWYQVIT